MRKSNYHSHTKYSNAQSTPMRDRPHATGEINEIVEKAISLGFTTYGFSEHVPFDSFESKIRTTKEDFELYIKDVQAAKVKYKDQIEIFCGAEVESLPLEDAYHKSLFARDDIDFLILGNHFKSAMDDKYVAFNSFSRNSVKTDDSPEEIAKGYVDSSIRSLDLGIHSMMAHADRGLPNHKEWNDEIIGHIQRLLDYTKEKDIVICAGIPSFMAWQKEPSNSAFDPEFWKLAAKNGNKVIIELDRHYDLQFDVDAYNTLDKMLKDFGVNQVNTVKLIEKT